MNVLIVDNEDRSPDIWICDTDKFDETIPYQKAWKKVIEGVVAKSEKEKDDDEGGKWFFPGSIDVCDKDELLEFIEEDEIEILWDSQPQSASQTRVFAPCHLDSYMEINHY